MCTHWENKNEHRFDDYIMYKCYTNTGKTFRLSVAVMTYDFIVLLSVCSVLPLLQHVKRSKAVYSVISHSYAKLIRKPWLKYWDQCNTKRKRYWVEQLNVFPVIMKHKHNMSSCLQVETGLNCGSVHTLTKQEWTQIWWLQCYTC